MWREMAAKFPCTYRWECLEGMHGEDGLVFMFTYFVFVTCEQYTCSAYLQVHICVKNLVGVCVSRLYVFLYYKCLRQRGV